MPLLLLIPAGCNCCCCGLGGGGGGGGGDNNSNGRTLQPISIIGIAREAKRGKKRARRACRKGGVLLDAASRKDAEAKRGLGRGPSSWGAT